MSDAFCTRACIHHSRPTGGRKAVCYLLDREAYPGHCSHYEPWWGVTCNRCRYVDPLTGIKWCDSKPHRCQGPFAPGQPTRFEITDEAIKALEAWAARKK